MVRVVVAVVQLTQGELVFTYITVGVHCRIILYYLDNILSVHNIEVNQGGASGVR